MYEIERKFLVKSELFKPTGHSEVMKQAYLSVDPERVVRIRREGGQACITIKGKQKGISRVEFEYSIPVADAEELMELALYPPIEKIRHRLTVGNHLWEVDEFLSANSGLLMAEVELGGETEEFVLPEWAGEEVTHDRRYYNSWLSMHPFNTW